MNDVGGGAPGAHGDVPLLEFDPSERAVIEPEMTTRGARIPERLVLCFFRDVIEAEVAGRLPEAHRLNSEVGPHPVWVDGDGDGAVGILHPGVGAPLAAACLEEAIAAGARRVVAVGGAGAIVPDLALGHVVVPDAAVRDEGTSYHYLPPSRTVEPDPAVLATTLAFLERRGVPHVAAPTWTTDAIYRETPERLARRRAEGCITVEMETAAFYAVARFRGIDCIQLLYAADDLSGEAWDDRGWMRAADVRTSLYRLAIDLAREL
jgi:uridine phosphorylase